jgi:fatty acid desaturase
MGFEIIGERKASFSGAAAAAIVVLAFMLLGMAAAFAYLLISGKGNDYLLGTLLAFELLLAGIEVVLFVRFFVTFRRVAEDREEELLW